MFQASRFPFYYYDVTMIIVPGTPPPKRRTVRATGIKITALLGLYVPKQILCQVFKYHKKQWLMIIRNQGDYRRVNFSDSLVGKTKGLTS
jgi:hypothetical protein